MAGRQPLAARGRWRRGAGIATALLCGCALIGTACGGSGAYPLDYFPEMHYQASVRLQEPPRLQDPADSVAYDTNSHPEATISWRNPRGPQVNVDLAAAQTLRNPLPRTDENIERGRQLFAVNCVPCHGAQGHGDGRLASYFQFYKVTPPINLSSAGTKSLPEGVIWWTITNGRGNMPHFQKLLTDDERWLLTMYVQSIQ